jgi:hypothetical protein
VNSWGKNQFSFCIAIIRNLEKLNPFGETKIGASAAVVLVQTFLAWSKLKAFPARGDGVLPKVSSPWVNISAD